MTMIVDAINRILELSNLIVIEEKGKKYTNKPLYDIKMPSEETLKSVTIEGMVSFAEVMPFPKSECLITVDSQKMQLLGPRDEVEKDRDLLFEVNPIVSQFRFGQYLPIEDFIVKVNVHFVDTPELRELVKLVSNISSNQVLTVKDDGMSQSVTVKDDFGRDASTQTSPFVDLRPWRTFREIEQPESRYIVRLSKNGDKLPVVTLFADESEIWRYKSITDAAAYIRERLPEIPVIA